MENYQNNLETSYNDKHVDDSVLRLVKRRESRLLQNIKWISFGVAALYLLGYIWRVFYYGRLGIPVFLLDFPFPEILVPKSWGLIIFLVSLIFSFGYPKFRDYFAKTTQGRFPEGLYIPKKVAYFVLLLLIGLALYSGLFWHTALAALGYFMGKVTFKLSHIENRVQFWHMLWICIVLACGIQAVDGAMSARSDIENDKFPFVSISAAKEEDATGMLLGFFKGKYFIMFLDEHDFPKLRILDAQYVEKIDLNYRSWTVKSLRKLKEDFHKLEKRYDELIRMRDALRKETNDPNLLDDIEINKPVWPFKDI